MELTRTCFAIVSTHGKKMAKPSFAMRFDNGTTLRTNVRTYVDNYSREISSSYVRDACEKRPKSARSVVDSRAASLGPNPISVTLP